MKRDDRLTPGKDRDSTEQISPDKAYTEHISPDPASGDEMYPMDCPETAADIRSFLLETTVTGSGRVNRTHRVVRERAQLLAARRSKVRSLWLPLLIFSSLLLGICFAVWAVLDEYELAVAGTQVASYQVLVPLFWSVPVSAAVLAVVWFRQLRAGARRDGDWGPMR